MKSYAIFTACDTKFGDFLTDHWLKSLCDNVDLRNLEPGFDHYVNEAFFSKEDCKQLQVVFRDKDMLNSCTSSVKQLEAAWNRLLEQLPK